MSEILKIDKLTIALKQDKRIIDDNISFKIEENGSLVILGESGSGKTMICRTILKLLGRKSFDVSGKVIFEGNDILAEKSKNIFGNSIALIPQNPMTAFDPSVRIGKQLVQTLRLHKKISVKQAKNEVLAALEKSGLSNAQRVYDSYSYTLSGGMLQRAIIAMAIMVKPKLILADEPTTALDAEHRTAVIETLAELRDSGTAIMLITHDFVAARQFGGMAIVMKEGRIVERGTVESMEHLPKSVYCRSLIEASQLCLTMQRERARAC